MHELSTSDLLQQEDDVRKITYEKLGGFCSYSRRSIDLLIRLYYRLPKIVDVESDEGNYLSHVGYWFYMAFFSFRACIVLWERGYYLEAHIILRSLIEILVKMRYFENHKDLIKSYDRPSQLGKTTKITFKKMFDEVLPGYYETEYKWMFSHMAHGGVGARIFKINFISTKERSADTGVVYNEKWATFVTNNFSCFMFGYLRFYKKVYKETTDGLEADVRQELGEIEDILLRGFKEHIKLKGGENDWHKVARKIWDF